MTTMESAEQAGGGAGAEAQAGRGWVKSLVIGLVALLIGLGVGWLAFAPEPPDDVDREIQALVDDYAAAWNANDGQAVVALMTADGVHYSGGAALGKEAASDSPAHSLAYFVEHHVRGGTFETVGDTVVRTTDGPPYMAANVIEMSNGGNDSWQSVNVYRIVPEDGVLKIQVHTTLIEGLD